MSTEEVYLRSFVTAAAIAAVVAFLVFGLGFLARKRLGRCAGLVGALALGAAWIAAHMVMRGPEAWADLMRGGNGWKRAIWPIEATDRFPVFVALAFAGGAIASLGPSERSKIGAIGWLIRVGTIAGVAWASAIPLAESAYGLIGVGTLMGVAWWTAMEDSEPAKDGALGPLTAAVCSAGFGALMMLHHAVTLGCVAMCGGIALCAIGIAGARHPRLTRGPAVCAVGAGGWTALFVGSQVFAYDWPPVTVVLACAAPLTPALFGARWIKKRPAWNRWVSQLALSAGLMAVANGIVLWDRHNLRWVWPF